MNSEIFYRHRLSHLHIENICLPHMSCIHKNHQARANGLHEISFGNKQAGIFSKSYSDVNGVAGACIQETSYPSTLAKMRVNHHIVDEAESSGYFNFTFAQSFRTASLVYH